MLRLSFVSVMITWEKKQSDDQTVCRQANSVARLSKPLYLGVNPKISALQCWYGPSLENSLYTIRANEGMVDRS